MNTRLVEEFSRRYQAKIIDVPVPHGHIMYYERHFQPMVEIELYARAFEELVNCDARGEQDYMRERTERIMRDKFPAVADAFQKYRMLLELYR